jgi:hypothetical protein
LNNVAIAEEMKGLNANGKSKFVDFRGTRKGTILLCVWCEKATEWNENLGGSGDSGHTVGEVREVAFSTWIQKL